MYMCMYTYIWYICMCMYVYIHINAYIHTHVYLILCIYTHTSLFQKCRFKDLKQQKSHFEKPLCDFFFLLLTIVHSWMLYVASHISEIQPTDLLKSISSNLNLLSLISLSTHVYAAIAWYWRCNCEPCLVIGCTVMVFFFLRFFFFLLPENVSADISNAHMEKKCLGECHG